MAYHFRGFKLQQVDNCILFLSSIDIGSGNIYSGVKSKTFVLFSRGATIEGK